MSYTQLDPNNPPPPLTSQKVGSFAHFTLTTRLPQMIQQVMADYADEYPLEIQHALQALHDELVNNDFVGPLNADTEDGLAWFTAWQPYQNQHWLDIPWFFAETFLYRRLLQACGYFGWPLVAVQQHPPDAASRQTIERWEKVDPFARQKAHELASDSSWQLVQSAIQAGLTHAPETLTKLLAFCLWGNRVDLSYTQVVKNLGKTITVEQEQDNLLIDHRRAVVDYLQQQRAENSQPPNVAFICDNAGTELLTDLILADFLLRYNWVSQLTLHVKADPTYVSDSTPYDIYLTLMALSEQDNRSMNELSQRLQGYGERLHVKPHRFWNSSHFFWQIPHGLQTELSTNRLVIIKGDANYRRLLGDSLAWPLTIPLAEVASYFPAPFVSLRTLKSPPIVGLQPGQAETLEAEDGAWRINGKRGIIQAALPT